MVRGALCHKCNTGLGVFQDSVVLLREANKYIKIFESKILSLMSPIEIKERLALLERAVLYLEEYEKRTGRG
jgi:hypothetical protein